MSHIFYDELDYVTVSDRTPCTGCIDGKCSGHCNGSFWSGQKLRDPAEAFRLKEERARKREDEILAQADAIRARRSSFGTEAGQ